MSTLTNWSRLLLLVGLLVNYKLGYFVLLFDPDIHPIFRRLAHGQSVLLKIFNIKPSSR